MNNGLYRRQLEKQLNTLYEQRAYYARFSTQTAVKKTHEADAEIAELESLLFPKQPAPTVSVPVFIHPATGTIPNGL